MTRALAIARRDFASYFLTPTGYIITALYLLLVGFAFVTFDLQPGLPATLRGVLGLSIWFFVIVCPAITMRLVSEEARQGTLEALMTAPVREMDIIFGKFGAALAFLAVMMAPTGIYIIALESYGRPDYGELLCGYGGTILAGAAYLACGLFMSTMTSSQVLAFLLAFCFWGALTLGTTLLVTSVPEQLARILIWMNPGRRLDDFVIGLFDTANVAYFLAITLVFLAAAVVSLQSRRWR